MKHLKKQAEEVDLILERMEEQASMLFREYHREMEQIEAAFATERKELLDNHRYVDIHVHVIIRIIIMYM